MFRFRRRAIAIALLMVLPLVLAACSATGGKKAAEAAAGEGTAVAAGHANTKHYTIAMITHNPDAAAVAHRTIEMRDGRVVSQGVRPQLVTGAGT
jgi:ABC-type lipoprotein export system ATPase subunit